MPASESAMHTDRGIAAAAKGDLSSAVGHFQAALRADPLNYDAYFQLGRVFLEQGQLERAAQSLSRLERKLPRDTEVRLLLADVLRVKGDAKGALRHLDAAARLAPARERIPIERARLLSSLGRWRPACRVLRRYVKRHPEAVEARCELGWVLLHLGRTLRAQKEFDACLAIAPDHRRAKEGINRLIRLVINGGPGSVRAESADAAHQAAAGGTLVDASRALAEKRPADAVRILERILEREPSEEGRMLLGIAYQDAGRLDESAMVFEELLAQGAEPAMVRLHLAATHNARQRYDRARQLLQQALKDDPDFAEAYFELGIACQGLGDKDEATRAYTRAIAAGSDDWRVFVNLASLYYELGRLDQAGKVAADCAERHPDCWRAHVILAHIAAVRGQYRAAAAAARAALGIDPLQLDARKYLAIALFELGHREEVREELRALAERMPGDSMLQPYLAQLETAQP